MRQESIMELFNTDVFNGSCQGSLRTEKSMSFTDHLAAAMYVKMSLKVWAIVQIYQWV